MFGKKRFSNRNERTSNKDKREDLNHYENKTTNSKECISICQICNMPVKSIYTAIRHRETGEFVHFDCVIRELIKENSSKLGKNLKIYYVGSGNFAIVKEIYDKRGFLKTFEIVERIEYEKR
jgi:hypothetical protein